MAVYLDEPFDDEPVFSVIARYLEGQGPMIKPPVVLTLLLGEAYKCKTTTCSNTARIASETQACWGMSAEEIAEGMTTYPYFAAFVSAARAKEMLDRVVMAGRRGRFHLRAAERYQYRYCPACLSESRRRGEPLHWLRTHQLPGVVICIHHAEILWEWECEKALSGFVTPGSIHGKPVLAEPSPNQKSALLHMAKISDDLLNRRVCINPELFGSQFRAYLVERSQYFAGIRYQKCVTRLFEATFGPEYLDRHPRLGSQRRFEDNRSEIRYTVGISLSTAVIFVAAATLVCRIEDDPELLADKHFADIYRDKPSAAIRCRPQWWVRGSHPPPSATCPNKVAGHGADHLIEHWYLSNGLFRGRCSCGMRVTYDAGAVRVTRYSEDYRQAVKTLVASGMSPRLIASQLEISTTAVHHVLRSTIAPTRRNVKEVPPAVECPSLVALHGRGHNVDHMDWRDGKFRGKCCCGVKILLNKKPSGGYAVRISRRGPLERQEIVRLAALGMSVSEIAKKLTIPYPTVCAHLAKSGMRTTGQETPGRTVK